MMPESSAADRALLRRFEPIVRYTHGENFFPMAIEPYVRECSLWVLRPGEDPECLVPEGELTLEKLAEPHAEGFQSILYLQFIEEPNLAEIAFYLLSRAREGNAFHRGRGRLARVGYSSRFVGALFSLTLLARGRIPGETAAAAALTYRRLMDSREHYTYYARVVRQNGWIVLQYWFFYPFNNWRSGFFGVNDHEADWEMVNVYLSENASGEVQPEWVAYAAHDFSGDDLRRRWDDGEVEKVGEHPVIYAGAAQSVLWWVSAAVLHPDDGCDGQYHVTGRGGDGDAGGQHQYECGVDYAGGFGSGQSLRYPRRWPDRRRWRHHESD